MDKTFLNYGQNATLHTNSASDPITFCRTHVDFLFEWASMLMNIALWFSKKAAKISSTENISEEQAKQVHKCLRYAAGLMKHCKEELFPKIIVQMPKESDGDPNILDAYIYQFGAEAQEVLVYEQAVKAAADYGRSPGVGLTVKPAQHLFFRNLEPLIDRHIRRAMDENTMIYHQKVPDEFGELSLTAEFGLAKPEMPPVEFRWAPEWKTALQGFDSNRTLANILEEQKKADKNKTKTAAEAPLEETNEKPIYETDKDPSTKSGCTIS
ncbi:hypothetical protein Ciccas_010694 [Cichlidogyrus casuarinus]|uniref:BRO1 domain-containing protein n=1 Tax=Cichlidogyrus casuarinus TaxID=1844966 RepID=A0ABD2PTF5_9PLAT